MEEKKDQLWNISFETYYDTYYEELVADALIDKWQLLDEITKVLVALTATGSVVAGWSLWTQPNFKMVWAILAGIGAILSIIHSKLNVPSRLENFNDVKTHFTNLRIDFETLRGQMQINSDFEFDKFNESFLKYRDGYKEGAKKVKNDILKTKKFQLKIQDQLNNIVEDQLEQEEVSSEKS